MKNWSFISQKSQKIAFALLFWFSVTKQSLEVILASRNDQKYPRYPLVLKSNVTSTAAAFNSVFFSDGNSSQIIGACIFMPANETGDLVWMGSSIQNNC